MTIDANTLLLLDFNGSDGDTSIIDTRPFAHGPITTNNAVQLSNAQFKFAAGTSRYHPATANYWIIPDHAVWDFLVGSSTPFTIVMWLRFLSIYSH